MALIKTNPQHYRDIAGAIRTRLGVSTAYPPEDMAAAIGGIEGAAVGSIDPGKISTALPGAQWVLTDDAHYTAIAAAIRAKRGTALTYTPGEMAAAILGIATSTECTVTVAYNAAAAGVTEVEYLSGGETMQPGELLTMRVRIVKAGSLLSAVPTATMGGVEIDLTPYITTGATATYNSELCCKEYMISNLPVTGDLVITVNGYASTGLYLFRGTAENGTVAVNEYLRQTGGSCRFTFTPDAGYGLDGTDLADFTPDNTFADSAYLTITDMNTGEIKDNNTFSGRYAQSVGGGKYYLMMNALPNYDQAVHVAFTEIQEVEPPAGNSYTVTKEEGATHGFSLGDDGWYINDNKGVNSSAALARISLSMATAGTVTLQCVNYAEPSWDFGYVSYLDTTLSLDWAMANSDTDGARKAFNQSSDSSTAVVSFDYEVPAGDHFIVVKFKKDSTGHSNGDYFKFKVSL